MTPDQLAELERLEAAATPGPITIGIAPEEVIPTYLIGANSLFYGRFVGKYAEADAMLFQYIRHYSKALIEAAKKCADYELLVRAIIVKRVTRTPMGWLIEGSGMAHWNGTTPMLDAMREALQKAVGDK